VLIVKGEDLKIIYQPLELDNGRAADCGMAAQTKR
jgi:hypothetical protein